MSITTYPLLPWRNNGIQLTANVLATSWLLFISPVVTAQAKSTTQPDLTQKDQIYKNNFQQSPGVIIE